MSESLPGAPPTTATRRQLWWFDLTRGRWAALKVLRRRLGTRAVLALAARLARLELGPDPLAALGPARDPRDELTRAQLRPVLLLDAALAARGHAAPERLELLRAVVGESGAAFLGHELRGWTRERFEALDRAGREEVLGGVLARFFNMHARPVHEAGHDLGFDVSACLFAELTRRLGRPELAALFCAADEVFFARPESPLRLTREETLARGDARCAFRLDFAGGTRP